jgi:hypothetical protein
MNEIVTKMDTLAILNKSEIDQQIATAKAYPRTVTEFTKKATELATLNDKVAAECIYALPRDGKVIEGPSARLAEILAHSWGNSRSGARVIEEGFEFVTAQGMFHDLETNHAVSFEVKRRITDRRGNRYSPDMIATTANAAGSIALRNAVLKGIPKALWSDIYERARLAAVGDVTTLANKRAEWLKAFQAYGVDEKRILAVLGVGSMADVGIDELAKLRGIFNAIKDGEITPENAFPPTDKPKTEETKPAASFDEFAKGKPEEAKTERADPNTGEIISVEKKLEAWSNRLKAVSTADCQEIFESEIDPAHKDGAITDEQRGALVKIVMQKKPG